jgi:hypothetical protein
MEISIENPFDSLFLSQNVITIVELSITYKMNNSNVGVNIGNLSLDPRSQEKNSRSAEKISGNGSFLGNGPLPGHGSFVGNDKKVPAPPSTPRPNQYPNQTPGNQASKNTFKRATVFAGNNNYALPQGVQVNLRLSCLIGAVFANRIYCATPSVYFGNYDQVDTQFLQLNHIYDAENFDQQYEES